MLYKIHYAVVATLYVHTCTVLACCSSTDAPCEDGNYDYPSTADAPHQEGTIQMTENPAYAAFTDYAVSSDYYV